MAFFSAMRVLIVPDKFKGTLTARQAAEAIALGWREARPEDQLELLPMSDGGDGFGEIVGELLNGIAQRTMTVNAAHQPVDVTWWWSESTSTAVVESARAIGLAMLPRKKFHPFQLDTYGLGTLLRDIQREHAGARFIVGIGGSATNDGGFGMARALGYRFLDRKGTAITEWTKLEHLERIEKPADISSSTLTIATDVRNPFLGPDGATRVFGPQKGLKASDFPTAERSLGALVQAVSRDLRISAENDPGAGAAGGLGYGLRVFLGGSFEPGIDIFARLADLSRRITKTDLVITGEGMIDAQTQMGKGTGTIALMARELGKQCIGLAGSVTVREGVFSSVHGMVPDLASMEEAMARAGDWLRVLSRKVAEERTI